MYNYAKAAGPMNDWDSCVPCAASGTSAGRSSESPRYYRRASESRRGRGPDSAGFVRGSQPRGDTRIRSRNGGQLAGPPWASRGYVHQKIDSAKDERNLKPPLEGPHVRRLFPLRRQLHINKVRPLNTEGPSMTSEARRPLPSARDSARYAMFITSSSISKTVKKSTDLVVVGQSCKLATVNCERTSSCLPVKDDDRPSSVTSDKARVTSKSRPRRPWTSRLRSLFAPRHRGTTTAVEPFYPPQGSPVGRTNRLRSLREDQSDSGCQGRNIKALAKSRTVNGIGGNASTGTMHRRQGSAAMTTRPASCSDSLPIPGVPHPDWEHLRSTSPLVPRNDSPSSSQENEVSSLIVSYDDQSLPTSTQMDASSCNSSVSVSTSPPSQEQKPMTEGTRTASDKEGSIPSPNPLTPISRGDGKCSEISSESPSSPTKDREHEEIAVDDSSVSRSQKQSPAVYKEDASADLGMCSSPPQAHELLAKDEEGGCYVAESTLKPVARAPCSTATNDDSLSSSVDCSSKGLETEILQNGEGAPDIGSSNLPPSPSRSDASISSLQDHNEMMDENTTVDDGVPASPLATSPNEVALSASSIPKLAISENYHIVEGITKDKRSPPELASETPTSRSGIVISPQAFAVTPSSMKEEDGQVSENECSISTPESSSEEGNAIITMEMPFLTPYQDQDEVRENGDLAHDLESISKTVSPSLGQNSNSQLSATPTIYTSSYQKLELVKEHGDSVSNDERAISSASSKEAGSNDIKNIKSVSLETSTGGTMMESSDVPISTDPSTAAVTSIGNKPPTGKNNQRSDQNTRQDATRFPTIYEQRLALQVNVVCALQSSSQGELSKWLAIVLSCIERRKELHGMLSAANYDIPYTREEAKEIEANGKKAKEVLCQFKRMTSLLMAKVESQTESSQSTSSPKHSKYSSNELSKGTSGALSQAQSSTSSLRQEAAFKDLQSSPGILSKEHSKEILDESVGNVQRSSPNGQVQPESSGSDLNLSKEESAERISRSTVKKGTSSESQHSSQFQVLKMSSLKTASVADNKTTAANLSPAKNAPTSQSPQNRIPDLTAYPSIDPSELEFILSNTGRRVMLGSGNYGEVLLMRRQGDSTLLAVKVLTSNFSLLQHEVAAMHAVRNCPFFPKFVGVIDYCSYAQELVGGVGTNTAYNFSMARYQYNLLTALEWLHVCRNVTEGLKDLHAAGWLHNDLHCGNAMVCPNPPGSEVAWSGKIIDLGNAQQISSSRPLVVLDEEQQNIFYKLAKQCAPEVLEGRDTFTVKSDIYSLGKLFVDVAGDADVLHGLRLLGEFSCMRRSPGARPTLDTISGKLNDLISQMVKAEQQPSGPSTDLPSASSSSSSLRRHLS